MSRYNAFKVLREVREHSAVGAAEGCARTGLGERVGSGATAPGALAAHLYICAAAKAMNMDLRPLTSAGLPRVQGVGQ